MKPFNQCNGTCEASTSPIHQKLKRILQLDRPNSWTVNAEDSRSMITKIIVHPNPFDTFIAMEITCVQSKHLIIRVTDEEECIVKMFSWFVVKGDNVSTFHEMGSLMAGNYYIDIMDLDGELLFSTELVKQSS